jgi:hypothetical protein
MQTLETHHDPEALEKMGFSKEEIPELKIYGPKGCPSVMAGIREGLVCMS